MRRVQRWTSLGVGALRLGAAGVGAASGVGVGVDGFAPAVPRHCDLRNSDDASQVEIERQPRQVPKHPRTQSLEQLLSTMESMHKRVLDILIGRNWTTQELTSSIV